MILHHTGGDRSFNTQHRGLTSVRHTETGLGCYPTSWIQVPSQENTQFSFQVINYSMGMKNPGRQSTSRNANYWEKLPKVRSKRVSAAHSLCPSEGDHKKLERKGGWCGASQQTKEQAGAGMGVVGRDEVVLNTQCFQTKHLIPSSNSCTSPSLYLLHIHISLTYILRAINNPE